MSTLKFTLANRITTLLIFSSLIFISVFTFIQVNNQLSNISRYNAYQANLSGAILKSNLEATIRQAPDTETATYIQAAINELKASNLIKETSIYDGDGKIVASTEKNLIDKTISYKDLAYWDILNTHDENNKWFTTAPNRLKHTLDMYITVRLNPQGSLSYIAKSSFYFASVQEALVAVYKPIIISIFIIVLANIILGIILSKAIIGPIKILNNVTKIIANGNLAVRTQIKTNDELQELGITFNHMTEQLVIMKTRAENANPLTKLPGNIVIQEEVEKYIQNKQEFMAIYCDLDNFKAFNDKYGIAKGDEAIKLTAEIFKEAIKNKGNAKDFIGHEGGDDFILLTTPIKAQAIADFITSEFDKRIRNLYSEEDLKQGYIVAHARDHSIKQFPIMTISLAGISNEIRPISSYGEVTNIAAEIKKKAKAIDGSIFIVNQRRT